MVRLIDQIGHVKRPGPAARNAARSGIEPDRDSLVHDVRAISIADLIARHQAGTVVHRDPGLDLDRLCTAARPLGQPRQERRIDASILAGMIRLQIGLPDVVDHIVLLLRRHLSFVV